MPLIPLVLIIYAGFIHAFETDHLLAVSNIVTRRHRVLHAIKDGVFWGLGHTSTLFIVGMGIIVFKMNISAHTFHYFEAAVGVVLITLGAYRLWTLALDRGRVRVHGHAHDHGHDHRQAHTLAYGVGLVHGLAGSGALVVMVMVQTKSALDAILYLLIFGAGSILGMLAAAGVFSVPFSRKWIKARLFQASLVGLSSVLCLVYGGVVIYQNLAS